MYQGGWAPDWAWPLPKKMGLATTPGTVPPAVAPYVCRLWCRPQSPRPLCRCAPCLQAAVWSPVTPALDPLLSHPTRAGCGVVPSRPSPAAVAPHACRLQCRPRSPRLWHLCRRAPCVQGCGVVPSCPGPSAVAPHACRLRCGPWSPRPICCRDPCVQGAVSSPVAPAPLPSCPTRAGCSVVPGRPGAGPSAVAPHTCRLRCGPRLPRRWPLCSRAPRVQAAVSSPVAVSGQQCSREFLLAQPTSLVPPAWRGLLALNRAAGLGSQPPCRATLYQPGPWWRNGFGVRFSVSPTIVKLLVWIQTSCGLHLPMC
ncbi:hypothetical protein R6Z07M_014778 [Ovis aries]